MFVLQKTYDKLQKAYCELKEKQDILSHLYQKALLEKLKLQHEWNDLAKALNKKGGRDFLKYGVMPTANTTTSISQEEVRVLIKLCHPDKHRNSKEATEITQRLLSMRK